MGEGHDLPDAGQGMCCMGAAALGPTRCTCWTRVYDQPQAPPCEGPMRVRDRMCDDCAFRPDSPERSGDARYQHSSEEELAELAFEHFACHQGMRRVLRVVHPSGVAVESIDGAYAPPNACAPTRADGTPAELCAGWWAARQRMERGR